MCHNSGITNPDEQKTSTAVHDIPGATTHLELVESYKDQFREALGDDNRYFADQWYQKNFGRNAGTDDELIMYYVLNGGAVGHRKRMNERHAPIQNEAATPTTDTGTA